MTAPRTVDQAEADLAALDRLKEARLSAYDYYMPYLASDDDVLFVGGWCAVLTVSGVPRERYADVVKASRYPCIRRLAFDYFDRILEHDFSKAVATVPQEGLGDTDAAEMAAKVSGNDEALLAAAKSRFLATGQTSILQEIGRVAEGIGGWRKRLMWSIYSVLLEPHEPIVVYVLLDLLYKSNQPGLIDRVVLSLRGGDLHPYLAELFSAASAQLRGDFASSRRLLDQASKARQSRTDVMLQGKTFSLRLLSTALDVQGDYRGSYEALTEFNSRTRDASFDLSRFKKSTLATRDLAVPQLPTDVRNEAFMMLGFPRSGTTLLENALSAHPDIETFEELPTFNATTSYLGDFINAGKRPERAHYVEARNRYYGEIDRNRRKGSATILIDKLPMRSAEAVLLSRLMPDKRYLFSIRHPFDVILSCLRQHFTANLAMQHFHTLKDAVDLYNFTMSQWFSVFKLEDERVQYVRYESLVEDFEPTMRGVFSFLGTPWSDSVHEFAKAADSRANKTPSYQKVRKGLSIGVQTYWRNYRFVFDTPEAMPLHKWAEFFGYPTK